MTSITAEQRRQLEQRLEEENRQFEANKPTNLPPCPPWCVLPDGHDVDGMLRAEPPGVYFRDHMSTEDADAWVMQEEQEHYRNDAVTVLEPVVRSVDMEFFPGVDAARARQAARELLEAADLLDRINHEPTLIAVAAEIRAEMARQAITDAALAEELRIDPARLSSALGAAGRALLIGKLHVVGQVLGVAASELVRRAERASRARCTECGQVGQPVQEREVIDGDGQARTGGEAARCMSGR